MSEDLGAPFEGAGLRVALSNFDRGQDRLEIRGRIIKRIQSDIRDDMALMLLDKALEATEYPEHQNRNNLLIASRWYGETVFPFSRDGMVVYVCDPPTQFAPGTAIVDSNSIRISDWATLSRVKLKASDMTVRAGYIRPITRKQADALRAYESNSRSE